jgi:hypothetical protein
MPILRSGPFRGRTRSNLGEGGPYVLNVNSSSFKSPVNCNRNSSASWPWRYVLTGGILKSGFPVNETATFELPDPFPLDPDDPDSGPDPDAPPPIGLGDLYVGFSYQAADEWELSYVLLGSSADDSTVWYDVFATLTDFEDGVVSTVLFNEPVGSKSGSIILPAAVVPKYLRIGIICSFEFVPEVNLSLALS